MSESGLHKMENVSFPDGNLQIDSTQPTSGVGLDLFDFIRVPSESLSPNQQIESLLPSHLPGLPQHYPNQLIQNSLSQGLDQHSYYQTLLTNDFVRNQLWQPYAEFQQQQQMWQFQQQQQLWHFQQQQQLWQFQQQQMLHSQDEVFYQPENENLLKPKDESSNTETLEQLQGRTLTYEENFQNEFESGSVVSENVVQLHIPESEPGEIEIVEFKPLSEKKVSVQKTAKAKRAHFKKTWHCQCINCANNSFKGKDRIHVCHLPGCDKSYKKTSHLKAHLNWHSGIRPFVCSQNCGKSFLRSDELKRHEAVHKGEKKYQCQFCHKGFFRSDHLNKHEGIHTKEKPTNPRRRRARHNPVDTIQTQEQVFEVTFGEKSLDSVDSNVQRTFDYNSSNSFTIHMDRFMEPYQFQGGQNHQTEDIEIIHLT